MLPIHSFSLLFSHTHVRHHPPRLLSFHSRTVSPYAQLSLESKRRASRKKNQKRREAAKRKALLLPRPTMAVSSEQSALPVSAVGEAPSKPSLKTESQPVQEEEEEEDTSSPFSEPSSPSLVSESTFSVTTSVEAATPALPPAHHDCDTYLSTSGAVEESVLSKGLLEHERIFTLPNSTTDAAGITLQNVPEDALETPEREPNETLATPTSTDITGEMADSSDNILPLGDSVTVESTHSLSSWDMASETVANVALQCLSKDRDMELSYVAILSAMTVLQTDQDQNTLDEQEHLGKEIVESKRRVAGFYSRILSLMCVPSTVESLGKEIQQQGVMAPESLYSQFYGSIQQAGYELEVSFTSYVPV
jgi:hypothetical protein